MPDPSNTPKLPKPRYTPVQAGAHTAGQYSLASTVAELFLGLRNDPTTRAAAERILDAIEARDIAASPTCKMCGAKRRPALDARDSVTME